MSIATGSTTLLIDRNNIILDSKGRSTQLVDDLMEPRLRQIQDSSQSEVADEQTSFRTARSRLSFRSFLTRTSLYTFSTGKQSQNGATWRQELVKTMDSGFGRGAPRGTGFVGDREGRERGGYLPHERGVGRIGRPPIDVPTGLAQAALGVVEEHEEEELNQVDFFVETAKAELERMMEWRSELNRRLDEIMDGEISYYDNISATLKSFFVCLGSIRFDMQREDGLFRRRDAYDEPSSKFCQEYEALELYRRLTLGCVHLGLQLGFPETYVEGTMENNTSGSGGPHTPISHSFGMAVFSAEASLGKLKQPRPVPHSSQHPLVTYRNNLADRNYLDEDFPTDHEWQLERTLALNALLQDLRKITKMMAAVTPRIIKEHRAEMKSREEKLLLLQTNLKEFLDKGEYTSIYQCFRVIHLPSENQVVEEQESYTPSTGDEEALESLEEWSPPHRTRYTTSMRRTQRSKTSRCMSGSFEHSETVQPS